MDGSDSLLKSVDVSKLDNGSTISFRAREDGFLESISSSSGKLVDMVLDSTSKECLPKFSFQNKLDFYFLFSDRVLQLQKERKVLVLIHCESLQSFDSFFAQKLKYADLISSDNVHEIFLPDSNAANIRYHWEWSPPSGKLLEYECKNYSCIAVYSTEDCTLERISKFSYYTVSRCGDSMDDTFFSESQRVTSPLTTSQTVQTQPPQSPEAKTELSLINTKTVIFPENYEDGPSFRSMLHELEQKSSLMKYYCKKIMKRIVQLSDAYDASQVAVMKLSETLSEASNSTSMNMDILLDSYLTKAMEIHATFIQKLNYDLINLLYEPFHNIYSSFIKPIDDRRLEFDEQSKSFYGSLSRYLSAKKDKKGGDSKFFQKEKTFALQRYDYYCFMQDLHDGSIINDINGIFLQYFHRQYDHIALFSNLMNSVLPNLQQLNLKLEKTKWSTTRRDKGREMHRSQVIQTSGRPKSMAPPSPSPISPSFPLHEIQSPMPNRRMAASADDISQTSNFTTEIKGKCISNGGSASPDKIFKEGLLLVFGATELGTDLAMVSKAAWHKHWIVVENGSLWEYANWKDSVKSNVSSISLKHASADKVRKQGRRFCFEVVTPKLKRLYQATSAEEMDSWIEAICEAAKISSFQLSRVATPLSASVRRPSKVFPLFSTSFETTPISRKLSGSGIKKAFSRKGSWNLQQFFRSDNSGTMHMEQLERYHASANIFIQMLRKTDVSNSVCADCGSVKDVTWCSINIPVVLCIECSGIHRSLGTHISKTRSLLLDSLSQQSKVLLCKIGNAAVNRVYEKGLSNPSLKPKPEHNAQVKLAFAQKKYVEHAFIDFAGVDADATLLEGLEQNKISKILLGLAAKPNFEENGMVFLKAVTRDTSKLHLLELLFMNGLLLPDSEQLSEHVSPDMQSYLSQKQFTKYLKE